jgi:hypothetical protein
MAEERYHKLTKEDLDKLSGEALPERAAMSLINSNIAIPINVALAANILSDSSIAYADAEQVADIDQST